MGDIIKGLWKWIVWILIILLLFLIILAIRIFIIDKDYDGKSSKSSSTSDTSSESGSLGQTLSNGIKTVGNSIAQGYQGDKENDYNTANFDERFLMYEGDTYEGKVMAVLDLLLENSNGNFYSRTGVSAVNFADNVSIKFNGNLDEYQNSINSLKEKVEDGNYKISFRYGGFGTYVNEIVVEKV